METTMALLKYVIDEIQKGNHVCKIDTQGAFIKKIS